MKILSYNIARNQGDILGALRSIQADVSCLQEVDGKDCEMLADGKHWAFAEATYGWGNMVITRFPIRGVKALKLPQLKDVPRVALVVEYQYYRPRTVVCTHLNGGDKPISNDERIEAIDLIDREVDRGIICGDFNHTPERRSALYAESLWDRAPIEGKTTANDTRDFIYGKGNKWKDVGLIDSQASDHKPIYAVI